MPDKPLSSYATELRQKIEAIANPVERSNVIKRLEKYQNGKATERDEDVLRSFGLIGPDKIVEAGTGGSGSLASSNSLEALAAILSRHFQGRLKIQLTAPKLCDWSKGRSLPPGADFPPAKESNRHNSTAWAAWIERYILPKYGVGTITDEDGKDIFQKADIAEAEEKIDSARIKKLERLVAEGNYQAVDVYLMGLRDVGAITNQKLNVMESLIPDQVLAAIPVDQRPSISEALKEACRVVIDAVRSDLANALREAGKKTAKVSE